MQVLREIPREAGAFKHPVVTLGSFDGVHLGHRRIFSTLLNIARQKAAEPLVITFSTHPRKILTPKTLPRILTTAEEKLEAIHSCGIETIIMLDFTHEMANMEAGEFLGEIVLKRLGVIDMVVGYDHAFGKNRGGNIDFLREISKTRGFGVTRVEPKNFYSRPISSSWIRTELEDGNVNLAASLLGRRYAIAGNVARGFGRGGAKLGFPTANIAPDDPDKVIPRDGVYAVMTTIDGGIRRQGMLNIGANPTFSASERTIEVNIFDFNEDIYGRRIEVEFVDRIRDEIRFDSVDALVDQLKKDRLLALEALNEDGP